jgi:hypothetical protein
MLRTMLYVLEGAEHINPPSRIEELFEVLLNQAQQERALEQVFSYLIAVFWCHRDTNHELETKKAIYDPIRNFFIDFFKHSTPLQAWRRSLAKTDDLNMYLKKFI